MRFWSILIFGHCEINQFVALNSKESTRKKISKKELNADASALSGAELNMQSVVVLVQSIGNF